MAGMRGNVAWLMGQKQTAKGTLATLASSSAVRTPLSGGNISPVREIDQLSETDASRDQGVSYVVTSGVEGTPEMYLRDRVAGFFLYWALGGLATTGTTNFTHTITPSNTLPYVSFWKMMGDTLWEQYQDCQVGSLTISAEAGGPLTIAAGINGLVPTRLTTDPNTTPNVPMESSAVYNFNDVTGAVLLGGSATALIRSFELTIENNIQRQQTDSVTPYDIYVGTREVSLGFDMYFETLTEYNKFHYGGAAGTTISPNIFTTTAQFTFTKGANNSVAFNLPSIAYTEFPVEPSASGDPVVSSVRAVAQRSGSPVITATVKNQQASM